MNDIPVEGTQAARPRSTADRGYLPTLDGWRAIAVALVIGAHSVPIIDEGGLPGSNGVSALFRHAGYGVDMFFALSGFLITTLLLTEKYRLGTINLTAFYARRFFRIIPPMAAYLLVVALIIPAATMLEIAQSLLFVRNYTAGSWYTGHFWSLSIEEHFYAVAPLAILYLARRRLLQASLLLVAACVVTRWFEFTYLSSSLYLPQFRTENRVDALIWGSIFAQLADHPAWREKMGRLLQPAYVVAIGLLAMAIVLSTQSTPVRRSITALVLPMVIAFTVFNPTFFFSKVLENRSLRYIGRLSYSLYLWQMMFLPTGERVLGKFQAFPIAFIAIGVLAWTSYNAVEKPFIRMGHRISRRLSRPYPTTPRKVTLQPR